MHATAAGTTNGAVARPPAASLDAGVSVDGSSSTGTGVKSSFSGVVVPVPEPQASIALSSASPNSVLPTPAESRQV